MIIRCRVCGNPPMWTLKTTGEKDRDYCSLTCLAIEVNEVLTTPYQTPPSDDNAKFYLELE